MKNLLVSCALIAALAACAPVSKLPTVDSKLAEAEAEKQRELVIEQVLADQARLHRVAYPIVRQNVALCDERIRLGTGLMLINKYRFPEVYRSAAVRVANLSETLQVQAVAPGSPAAAAGLRPGDRLNKFNGETVATGETALKDFGETFREAAQTSFDKKQPLRLEIFRGAQKQEVSVTPVQQCDVPYQISQQSIVNAFADGTRIVIAKGMMRFAQLDDELAIVVGHEIAHNTMGHISKRQGNQAVGMIFDIIAAGFGVNTGGVFSDIGGQAFSQGFEAEADYVGLYLTARAGYDINQAPRFWRRMGVAHPSSIRTNHAASHPGTPERFVALENTVKEILDKRAKGTVLLPEKQ